MRNDLDYANSQLNENELEEERNKKELDWYRTYSSFINTNFPNVCAQASAYADGDFEI